MKFIYTCQTDVGTVRKVNQDSLVIKSLNKKEHTVLMAAACDGVGSLSGGEVTSRRTAELLSSWFDFELPQIIDAPNMDKLLEYRCRQLIADINKDIYYSNLRSNISSGTTLSMLLIWDYRYLVLHVGDSRIYRIIREARQLTADHSWVAKEVGLGHMTPAQALLDARRNVILQCIGTSSEIEPDIFGGRIQEPTVFVICTDGFWHCMRPEEWARFFSPASIAGEQELGRTLCAMTEVLKQRGESDNITAVVIDIY